MSYVSEIVDTVSESVAASASAGHWQLWFIIVTITVFFASMVIANSMHQNLPATALEIFAKEISVTDDVLMEGIVNDILDPHFASECKTKLDG